MREKAAKCFIKIFHDNSSSQEIETIINEYLKVNKDCLLLDIKHRLDNDNNHCVILTFLKEK